MLSREPDPGPLLPVYVAWKPKLAVPLVSIGPFQPASRAVTGLPDWVTWAFHEFVIRWLPGKPKVSVQVMVTRWPRSCWVGFRPYGPVVRVGTG